MNDAQVLAIMVAILRSVCYLSFDDAFKQAEAILVRSAAVCKAREDVVEAQR